MEKLQLEVLESTSHYTLRDVCDCCGMRAEQVIEYVEFGIAEPEGETYAQWCFNPSQLFRLRRAMRLQRDLDVNLPGLALALDLLEEVEALRFEVSHLRKQYD